MVIGKNEELREWTRKVIEKMPHLTKLQAVVLAMWSFGIVMTQSCGLTIVGWVEERNPTLFMILLGYSSRSRFAPTFSSTQPTFPTLTCVYTVAPLGRGI
jgi:hypothetical protein